jgi:RNA polymerase sigma factor (sigma-70 family)
MEGFSVARGTYGLSAERRSAAWVTLMDRELVLRARGGDAEAFDQLAMAAFPRLKGVAYLVLRDADRAEDAVQDALLAAWKGLRALRDPDAWDFWLRRLVIRHCYRLAKKEQRRTQVELESTSSPIRNDATNDSADVADREWILSELARVDVEKRAVIVLHYYLDLSLREVGEILGIPYGTAASRLHRGLEQMRGSMHRSLELDGTTPREQQA